MYLYLATDQNELNNILKTHTFARWIGVVLWNKKKLFQI